MSIKLKDLLSRKPKKPIKLNKMQYPKTIEAEYYKSLKSISDNMKQIVKEELLPILKAKQSEYTGDGIVEDIMIIFDQLRAFESPSMAIQTASKMVRAVDKFNLEKLKTSINQRFGIDMPDMFAREGIEKFVTANIAKNATLIKSIPNEFIKDIETQIYSGISSGLTYKSIENRILGIDGIKSTFSKLDNRIKLIARNEVSSINGQINQQRLKSIGVNKFEWQTSGDERVRDSHADLDGQTFSWDNLPTNENGEEISPGTDFNCRCTSIPIFEIEEGEEDNG